jgi:hypothetical protein
MKKITKSQVKALLKKLEQDQKLKVNFTSSKTHLAGFKCWVQPFEIELSNDLDEFEKTINEFSYYNCNAEMGNRVHFYIKE